MRFARHSATSKCRESAIGSFVLVGVLASGPVLAQSTSAFPAESRGLSAEVQAEIQTQLELPDGSSETGFEFGQPDLQPEAAPFGERTAAIIRMSQGGLYAFGVFDDDSVHILEVLPAGKKSLLEPQISVRELLGRLIGERDAALLDRVIAGRAAGF